MSATSIHGETNHILRAAWRGPCVWALLLTALGLGGLAPAQAAGQPKKKKKPENITLTAKDGVLVACTYYPGAPSKQTVPIILVHDWGKNRGEMHSLALGLQGLKHAVIVPDLRGHGQSMQRRNPATGQLEPIDPDKDLRRTNELMGMVLDVDAAKSYLLERNNEEELNIEQLAILGDGVGAIIALQWALMDWKKPRLPAYKLGQDVKAMILVSPEQNFRGLSTRAPLAHPVIRQLPAMVMVGARDDRSHSDAKRIYNTLERYHDKEAQDLFFIESPTSLQGMQLIGARGLNNGTEIAKFINWILVRRADRYPWTDRTNPLQ